MPLITIEEYAEQHNLDLNYLQLLVAADRLPHKRQLGRIYVDDQFLEKMEEEQRFREEAWEREG